MMDNLKKEYEELLSDFIENDIDVFKIDPKFLCDEMVLALIIDNVDNIWLLEKHISNDVYSILMTDVVKDYNGLYFLMSIPVTKKLEEILINIFNTYPKNPSYEMFFYEKRYFRYKHRHKLLGYIIPQLCRYEIDNLIADLSHNKHCSTILLHIMEKKMQERKKIQNDDFYDKIINRIKDHSNYKHVASMILTRMNENEQ